MTKKTCCYLFAILKTACGSKDDLNYVVKASHESSAYITTGDGLPVMGFSDYFHNVPRVFKYLWGGPAGSPPRPQLLHSLLPWSLIGLQDSCSETCAAPTKAD